MSKIQLFKGINCPEVFLNVFPNNNYEVLDVPFELRLNDIDKINKDNLPFDDLNLSNLDKFYFMFSSLLKANKDILKHLNLIMAPTLKYCDLTADYLIIRHNRVLLVEFCYDLTSNKDDDMKESKVVFKMNKLESTLKKYLPVDTVVKTHLFFIRKGNNNFEIDRLARAIDEFYLRTTNKDLIKLIK